MCFDGIHNLSTCESVRIMFVWINISTESSNMFKKNTNPNAAFRAPVNIHFESLFKVKDLCIIRGNKYIKPGYICQIN